MAPFPLSGRVAGSRHTRAPRALPPERSWQPARGDLASPSAYLAADTSDNSDLEDDIILTLNE